MRDNCLIVSVYYLHVLYGCHSSPGTHLVSRKPASIGGSPDNWEVGPEIAPSISYLTFYRTKGHISSWTYKISDDRGLYGQARGRKDPEAPAAKAFLIHEGTSER